MRSIVLDGLKFHELRSVTHFVDRALAPLQIGCTLDHRTDWVKQLILHHKNGQAIYGNVLYSSVYIQGNKKGICLHLENGAIKINIKSWLTGIEPHLISYVCKFGGQSFITKISAKDACKALVDRYDSSNTITSLNDRDSAFVRDVVSLYPNANTMLENFLEFVIVEDFHRLRPFGIVKTDGPVVLFSYHNAIDGKFTDADDLKKAKRLHVADQVATYRTDNTVDGRGVCAVTGLEVSGTELHVDHNFDIMMFAQLWQNFLTEKGINDVDVRTIRGDSMRQRYFADIQLGNDWSTYHAKHANLRLVLAQVNMQAGRKFEPKHASAVHTPVE